MVLRTVILICQQGRPHLPLVAEMNARTIVLAKPPHKLCLTSIYYTPQDQVALKEAEGQLVTISEFTKNRFVQWAPKGPFSSVTQKSTNCGNTLYNDLYKPPSN